MPADDLTLAQQVEILKCELRVSQSSRLVLAAEMTQSATEKNALVRERNSLLKEKQDAIQAAQDRATRLEHLVEEANQQRAEAVEARKALVEKNEKLSATVRSMENSLSWRITKPLRGIMRAIRGGAPS